MRRKPRPRAVFVRVEALETRALLTAGASSANLLIGFQPGAPASNISAALGALNAQVLQTFPTGDELVQPGLGVNLSALIPQVEHMPSVRYVEQDTSVQAQAAPVVIPNDPQFPNQWGLSNPSTRVDINAPAAWSVTTGNPSTIIAVIDSGIDLNNPDFANRLWTNPGEIPSNGIDDSHDGYVDDVHGWNFLNNNNNLQDDDTSDHGTHVSGILGATGNNHYGVAGVNWNAQLMVLKFIGPNGTGDMSNAIQAIYYAVAHGARVINASWGQPDGSQALYDAVQYAGQHGTTFVMAAGNSASDNDFNANYATLDHLPNVIMVAGIDQSGNLSPSSNYGPNSVDIAAPGVGIRSDIAGGTANLTGTSMATAFVSGVASLVAGLHPDYSASQVVQVVLASARPLPTLTGLVATGGIVNAAAAVSTAAAAPISTAGIPGATADQVHATILGSDEFYAHSGGSDSDFVSALYQTLLGRSPSSGEIALWSSWITSGHTRTAAASAIQDSPEAAATKVARWFQSDLGWSTPLDQLKNLGGVDSLATLLTNGVSDSTVRAYILASQPTDSTTFLRQTYQAALGRQPTSSEISAWLRVLNSGTSRQSAAEGILQSPEARTYLVASWYRDDLGRNLPIPTLETDPGVVAWASLIQS